MQHARTARTEAENVRPARAVRRGKWEVDSRQCRGLVVYATRPARYRQPCGSLPASDAMPALVRAPHAIVGISCDRQTVNPTGNPS